MKCALFIYLLLFSIKVIAIDVVFINPSVPGTPFWDRVTASANAAASNLGMNLTIMYGKDNRIYNYNTLVKALSKPKKPDYIIYSPYDGSTERSFALLNKYKVNFITLERTLLDDEKKAIGLPQEKYPYWLGEIFHNNEQAGELLITTLINVAINKRGKESSPLNVIGISGSHSGESSDRVKGMLKGSKGFKNTDVLQISRAGWSREKARNIFFQFNERYNDIDIVWAASDGMALGVVDAISSGHSKMNQNEIVIGGIDWTPEAIKKIQDKQIDASVGGHFMQAAWALVKIYDQHHGMNVFKKSANTFTYNLEVITERNVEQYSAIGEHIDWSSIDFKRFTLFHNQKIKEHDFSFKRVIEQMK
jgi:ABC-type sugar transport system substrate-binding protein